MSGPQWWRVNLGKHPEPLNERQFMDFVRDVERHSAKPLQPHVHLLPGAATREPGDYLCIECGTLIHLDRPLT